MNKYLSMLIVVIMMTVSSSAYAASTNDISATVQIASYDINSSFSAGTGFFVSSMGTVLTNRDVIWDSNTNAPRENISVFMIENETDIPVASYTMEVWAYSTEYNLALLSPKNPIDGDGFVIDDYIGFNNSLGNPFVIMSSYAASEGGNLEYLSFDDVSLQSPISVNSMAASASLMNSGGPVIYNNEVVGLKLEGTGIVDSKTIFSWFQELTDDFTLTQPFVEVAFGNDYGSLLSNYEAGTTEPVETPVDTPDDTTTNSSSGSSGSSSSNTTSTTATLPVSTTTDTTDYSALSQEAQDFINEIQTFVREGQVVTSDGELMKWDDLTAKEKTLYPSDVVNPLLYTALNPETEADVTNFPDVPYDHPNSDGIFGLANMGIIKGYPDGTFKPDGEINRAELTKMVTLMRVITIPQVEDYNNCFPDVGSEWFAQYVCYAQAVGWIEGYPDGTFKPAQNVNRVEALKIILNSWFYETGVIPSVDNGKQSPVDADSGEWYFKFLDYAVQDELLDLQHASYVNGFEYFVGNSMTRKEVAETISRLLVK